MKIEDQVCSLENAKRLKELGVERDSLFTWATATNTEVPSVTITGAICFKEHLVAPAYTVAELGIMLKSFFAKTMFNPLLNNHKGLHACSVSHECNHAEYADTEANARAKMLIWLLENGHLTAEELNQ